MKGAGSSADGLGADLAAVDLAAALSGFADTWSPRTLATMNDYDVRVVKARGEFTRHSHPGTDELFLVLSGRLTIRLDAGDVTLGPGQLYVVPRGVPHQPVSPGGAELLLVEPSATVNTGDSPGDLTAPRRLAEAAPEALSETAPEAAPETAPEAAPETAPETAPEAAPTEGGEPACVMHRVCPACGRVAGSDPPTTCPGCGGELLPG